MGIGSNTQYSGLSERSDGLVWEAGIPVDLVVMGSGDVVGDLLRLGQQAVAHG